MALSAEDATLQLKRGETSMYLAARAGDLWRIGYQAGLDPSSIVAPNQFGRTPLHAAAEKGHLDAVKFLIKLGANANAPDNEDRTPLYLAAECGHLPVVEYLVSQKASPAAPSNCGATPLYAAAGKGHLPVIQYLFEQGVSLDVPSSDGRTPVWFAAFYKQPQAIALLASLGANLETPDHQGETPVHAAIKTQALECISLLVSLRPALLHTPDRDNGISNDGETPFQYAARLGRLKAVAHLGSLNPDLVHTPYRHGKTSFSKAIAEACTEKKDTPYREIMLAMLRLLASLGATRDISAETLRAHAKNHEHIAPLHNLLLELAENPPTELSIACARDDKVAVTNLMQAMTPIQRLVAQASLSKGPYWPYVEETFMTCFKGLFTLCIEKIRFLAPPKMETPSADPATPVSRPQAG